MLVRINYTLNGREVNLSYPKEETIRCIGSGAMVGQRIGDILTEDHPAIHGYESEVKSVTLTIMPDPEILNGR